LKQNISQAPILALPNLHNPFEVEMDASGYAIGVVLMQRGKFVCYHYEMFYGAVLNYPMYGKESYALVQGNHHPH
jgi:hypothetical protein